MSSSICSNGNRLGLGIGSEWDPYALLLHSQTHLKQDAKNNSFCAMHGRVPEKVTKRKQQQCHGSHGHPAIVTLSPGNCDEPALACLLEGGVCPM